MKILIIHCSYQYKGGEDTVVAEEIKLLRSSGADVELLLFSNKRFSFLKLLMLPFNPVSYFKVLRKIKSGKPDVIHIHNLHFSASASVLYAIKKSRIPFIITLHNYRLLCPSAILFANGKPFLSSIKQNFPWNAVKQGVYKGSKLLTFWVGVSMQLHKRLGIWKKCSRYIVFSEHSRNIFLNSHLGLKASQVIIKPNFCAQPLIKDVKRDNYFLYMGRLSEEKGVGLVLETFSKLPYRIRIAGDGPLKNEVIQYCKQYSNIEFLGILDKEKVFAELSGCTALIFPSIWYEGMPLTIIEAFACGTPVIASSLGVMETMITPHYNGLHFRPDCQADLSEKLTEWYALSDKEKINYSKKAKNTYACYYTPKKNAEQLAGIYHSAIRKEPVTENGTQPVLHYSLHPYE